MLWQKKNSEQKVDANVRCAGCKKWGTSFRCYKCKQELCAKCFDKHQCTVTEKKAVFTTSIHGNRCDFCGDNFIESKHASVCAKCMIIIDYNPDDPNEFFMAWNRVAKLILNKRFNIEQIDRHYYEDKYGKHTHTAIDKAIHEYGRLH